MLSAIMLSVIMLSVIILSVIMLNVIMLSVKCYYAKCLFMSHYAECHYTKCRGARHRCLESMLWYLALKIIDLFVSSLHLRLVVLQGQLQLAAALRHPVVLHLLKHQRHVTVI
jgi:hypothetical protein